MSWKDEGMKTLESIGVDGRDGRLNLAFVSGTVCTCPTGRKPIWSMWNR